MASFQLAVFFAACLVAVNAAGYGSDPSCAQPESGPFAAIAVLSGNSTVKGVVRFNQSGPGQPTTITGQLTGLDPNTKHGFHVHGLGDISNGCESAGAHYNPQNMTHGDIKMPPPHHVGDLGNVASDGNGMVNLNIQAMDITLTGKWSAIGRTALLHALVDDLGQGNFNDSKTTGHSGARIACGIVGQLRL